MAGDRSRLPLAAELGAALEARRMNEDLERLLACDEEGRVRLEHERTRARESLDSLTRRLEEDRDRKRRDLEAQLDRELAAIRHESESAAAERRRHRREFGVEQDAIASAMLPRAVDAFVRIVLDGPPEGRS